MIEKLALHYRANKRVVQMGLLFVGCCILHNFPELLNFLPDDPRKVIQTTVTTIIQGGVGFLAIFLVKQFNTSGSGTLDNPYTKPSKEGGTKTIQPPHQ